MNASTFRRAVLDAANQSSEMSIVVCLPSKAARQFASEPNSPASARKVCAEFVEFAHDLLKHTVSVEHTIPKFGTLVLNGRPKDLETAVKKLDEETKKRYGEINILTYERNDAVIQPQGRMVNSL